ncbi:MAG: tetratricopeptide repeat protein [Verrucomicrobiota bacterium]|nr:tetratricopeptide repeat protein [Verrucomicrobiota bacterium]
MTFSLRWLLFAVLLLPISIVAQTTGVDTVASARRDLFDGKYDAALATLDGAEKRGLTSGKLTELRGYIFLEQGKFDDAIKAFEAAKAQDKLTYNRLHIGDVLARQGKWEEARAAYQTGLKETDILTTNERLRFGVFIADLGLKDEEQARQALDAIMFPTESATYYYAQAAWAFAHGSKREGDDWVKRARDLFAGKSTDWFERHLYDFGWLKSKPVPISE